MTRCGLCLATTVLALALSPPAPGAWLRRRATTPPGLRSRRRSRSGELEVAVGDGQRLQQQDSTGQDRGPRPDADARIPCVAVDEIQLNYYSATKQSSCRSPTHRRGQASGSGISTGLQQAGQTWTYGRPRRAVQRPSSSSGSARASCWARRAADNRRPSRPRISATRRTSAPSSAGSTELAAGQLRKQPRVVGDDAGHPSSSSTRSAPARRRSRRTARHRRRAPGARARRDQPPVRHHRVAVARSRSLPGPRGNSCRRARAAPTPGAASSGCETGPGDSRDRPAEPAPGSTARIRARLSRNWLEISARSSGPTRAARRVRAARSPEA